MKLKYTIILFVSLILLGCAEVDPQNEHRDPGIYITLKTVSEERTTKAEWDGVPKNGIEELNENRLMTIDFFLYSNSNLVNPKASGHLDVEAQEIKKFKVDLTGTSFDDVFDGEPDATLFAIANLPSDVTLPSVCSIENLLDIVVEAQDFTTDKQVMDCFVMSGQSKVTKRTDVYADGEIEVQRTAAKFSVNATMENLLKEEKTGDWWTPDPTSFNAQFYFGNKYGSLRGDSKLVTKSDSLYTSPDRPMELVDESKLIYSPAPFYTYPRSWEYGDVDEPYLFLTLNMLPCDAYGHVEDDAPSVPCYYKILLTSKSFKMNHWYDISLQIKMLGSWTRETPTVIVEDLNCYVVDWNGYSGGNIPGTIADVQGVRFLQVKQDKYSAYNLDELQIPFSSSHKCKIISATYEHEHYNGTTFVTDTGDAMTGDFAGTFEIVNGESPIRFNHPLVLDFGGDMDTTPWKFTVTIGHNTGSESEDEKYVRTVTIMQYPPIILGKEVNDSRGDGTSSSSWRGNVYVNGQSRQTSTSARYNYVRTRENSYMYIIETKILPDYDKFADYIITDPRCTTPNQMVAPWLDDNLGGTTINVLDPAKTYSATEYTNPGSNVGPALYDGPTRKEMYYYATLTTPESENYISPKFRTSSNYCSMGATGSNTKYYDWVHRCASYQEAGYPAGRWRLPTLAEIQYIVQLQNNGLIPYIFMGNGGRPEPGGSGYYCATRGTGAFPDFKAETTIEPNTGGHSGRCVYDDWYWENTDGRVTNTTYKTENGRLKEADWDTFVWGDMPR